MPVLSQHRVVIRRIGGAFVAVCLAGLASCSQTTTVAPDSITCVYNEKTGNVDKGPVTKGGEVSIGRDQVVVELPASDRFWNISTDANKRDASASEKLPALDENQRETYLQLEIKFIIHPANACEFYETHLRRNEPLAFNTEGDAFTGWMKFLARNVDAAEWDAWKNFAPGQDGLLAALSLPRNANPDGTVPPDVTPESNLENWMEDPESGFGADITAEIETKLNGKYLCGPTTNVADPTDCAPVTVDVIQITLADEELITNWQTLKAGVENLDFIAEQERVAAETFEQQKAALQAQNARDAELAQLNQEQKIVNAEQQAYDRQQAALDQFAPCVEYGTIIGRPLTPDECVSLLQGVSGKYPNIIIPGATTTP